MTEPKARGADLTMGGDAETAAVVAEHP